MNKFESISSWAGLIPIAFLTLLMTMYPEDSAPLLWQSLTVYCCLILNFVGGIQWGHAQNLKQYGFIITAVSITLASIIILLMPYSNLLKIPFLMLTFVYTLFLDIYLISEHHPDFLSLRIKLTCSILAFLSLPLFSVLFYPLHLWSIS